LRAAVPVWLAMVLVEAAGQVCCALQAYRTLHLLNRFTAGQTAAPLSAYTNKYTHSTVGPGVSQLLCYVPGHWAWFLQFGAVEMILMLVAIPKIASLTYRS
jgi:hypothetical protein